MTYSRDPLIKEVYGIKKHKLSEEEKRYLEEEQDELDEVESIREYMEEKNQQFQKKKKLEKIMYEKNYRGKTEYPEDRYELANSYENHKETSPFDDLNV